ncbi:hypothetical protein MNBD_GAMMA11-901 [hydrothermal vent metagenome]|uniref:Uncharacterized protein n=1 Tax=hydrothermal vent metagenome TaxID=652676 RepID=A0A3B0WRI4_9ZZZZ
MRIFCTCGLYRLLMFVFHYVVLLFLLFLEVTIFVLVHKNVTQTPIKAIDMIPRKGLKLNNFYISWIVWYYPVIPMT